MCKIICITNRLLCKDDFLSRIKLIASEHAAGMIVLREKDLSEEAYYELALKVKEICDDNNILFVAHKFFRAAMKVDCKAIHMPLYLLEQMSQKEKDKFCVIGCSIHSVEEAKKAVSLGATYITAGHVFDTDCKKGLPGRGLHFIREVSEAVNVSVYGIGGINRENAVSVIREGAAGVCVMSGFMLESNWFLC